MFMDMKCVFFRVQEERCEFLCFNNCYPYPSSYQPFLFCPVGYNLIVHHTDWDFQRFFVR